MELMQAAVDSAPLCDLIKLTQLCVSFGYLNPSLVLLIHVNQFSSHVQTTTSVQRAV